MNIKHLLAATAALSAAFATQAQTIHVLYTTDIHGAIFPYDFVDNKPADHSLAHAHGYIEAVRDTAASKTILLDAGDIMQGTPTVYFYNYVDTVKPNITAQVYNYMKYDAICIGNHDIETCHNVYDKVRQQLDMPLLGANVINKATNEPYFKPYKIIEKQGKRIAVIGITTPYVPHWLPEFCWSGMMFDDMVESAQKWVDIVKEKENPDAIIGLFHAGFDYKYGNQDADTYKNENASLLVAERVEGFDVILIGHDHKLFNKKVKSPSGKTVSICDAGTSARNLGHAILTFDKNNNLTTTTKLIALTNVAPSEAFMKKFETHMLAVKAYSKDVIATATDDIISHESLFGDAAFTDIVHRTMLKYTGADISFTAPLLINTQIDKGPITVGKMFSLYRYENMLSTIELTGEEIKRYMEYSYDLWISNPDETGHLLNMNKRNKLVNRFYNFDSAAGINYTVNPFKPKGERVEIISMTDGTPFDMQRRYKVAINSYRSNGGGGHLEHGVGIPHDKIEERVISSVASDLRGLVMQDFKEQKNIDAKPDNNWKFVPEKLVKKYIDTDTKLFE